MEKEFKEYINFIENSLTKESIREAANLAGTLGKFSITANGRWEPVYYPGYTLITPTFGDDAENEGSYKILSDIKESIAGKSDLSKLVIAPDNALHMTVARLISGKVFEKNILGTGENEFLNAMRQLFSKLAISGRLRFEIKGISVFPQGVIAAMISPVYEDDYNCLQYFRDYIYSDKTLKELGVERKRGFKGHITLFYIEKELSAIEKQKLSEVIIGINGRFFTEPLPFYIKRAEVRRFDNFFGFYRKENWAAFEFI